MKRVNPSRRIAVAATCLALAVPAIGACSGDKKKEEVPAPVLPLPPSTTTTSRPDYTQIVLPPVATGATTTTGPRAPGTAAIVGRVLDDQGAPVPLALVRITYYRNLDQPEVIEVLSGEDGGYRFDALYGGQWRVRAWKEPFHARLEGADFFLQAGEQKVVDIKTKPIPEVAVTTAMAPNPPLIGYGTELAVKIVTQIVDSEGLVKRTPVEGTDASLSLSNGWSIRKGSNPVTTDENGEARWELTCSAEGPAPASVTFGGSVTHPFSTLSCLSPASTTTTTTAPPPAGGSPTSTTRRKSPTTTTTRKSTGTTGTTKPQTIKPR